jgi:acetyltransferase-like isoleucine patch superfamily enzyme
MHSDASSGEAAFMGKFGPYRPDDALHSHSLAARFSRKAAFLFARCFPNEHAMAAMVERLLVLPDDVITMGRWSYFDAPPAVHRYPGGPDEVITVGAFCSIAKDVAFVLSGNHDSRRVTTSPVRKLLLGESNETSGEISGRGGIIIGNDVWIGRGAMILSGARVADGAVIGARAVVAGQVDAYAVVAGNPAREIRKRFDADTVGRLLASAWWDLSDDILKDAVDLLASRDIERFLAHVQLLRDPTLVRP